MTEHEKLKERKIIIKQMIINEKNSYSNAKSVKINFK